MRRSCPHHHLQPMIHLLVDGKEVPALRVDLALPYTKFCKNSTRHPNPPRHDASSVAIHVTARDCDLQKQQKCRLEQRRERKSLPVCVEIDGFKAYDDRDCLSIWDIDGAHVLFLESVIGVFITVFAEADVRLLVKKNPPADTEQT